MKIVAWNEAQKADETIYLRLQEDAAGVAVITVDANGKPTHAPYVVTFSPDGTLYCHEMVNAPFQKDDRGRIIIEDEG